LNSIRIIHTN